MKHAIVLIALASPMQAELLAHFHTSVGTVNVALQYEKTPQTVANFITLAQGSRDRLDVATGAISRNPFYVGEKFFRVVNTSTFKIAQTGSGNGTNAGGGPGYTFKDEFDPTLLHVPYVLSMANSGPNTNGSQIFLTGNATIPGLDYVHTVFGLVTDPTSRSVVDAIHAAGNNGTTILNVTFSRNSPAAMAFDEFAQDLPSVKPVAGHLNVVRDLAATWNFNTPMTTSGDVFRAFRSTTLSPNSWSELNQARLHIGITHPSSPTSVSSRTLDNASAPKAFYHLSCVTHPGSLAPSTLASRSVEIVLGGGAILYTHNASGTSGTATYTPSGGAGISFPFNSFNFEAGGHGFTFIVQNIGINPEYLLIKIGCDDADDTVVYGRHSTSEFFFGSWEPFASGEAGFTR
jgi:cyclophilin family peptidyl-prolyl cis-trans isomerase